MDLSEDLQLMHVNDVARRLATTRVRIYKRAALGIFPRPIVIGNVGYIPRHEFNLVMKAYMAGKNEDEIKALVLQIQQAREREHVTAE